jgi:hypothetical protein
MTENTYNELMKQPVIKTTIASKADASGMSARVIVLTDLRSLKTARFEVKGKESNGTVFCCIFDDLIIACNFFDGVK